jgi:hypothetical protein
LTDLEKQKNPQILTVDTGGGEFDHHQTGDKDKCASTLIYEFLIKNNFVEEENQISALRRITQIVLEVDHFKEIFWEKPADDRYVFFLEEIFGGLKLLWQNQDSRLMEFGFDALDGILHKMEFKIKAEEEIKKSMQFDVRGMKCMAFEIINDEVLKLAQKQGYQVVIRKDPRKGYVRIKTIPNGKVDLTGVYEALQKKDPEATWFLHASKCIVLNGSTKNPSMVPTKLQLLEIIDVVKENL